MSTLSLSHQKPYEQRRLSLFALPRDPFPIVSIMLDLTLCCNLRCRYCFKEKGSASMPLRVAQDAVIWMIYASGSAKNLNVFFMGGEPLLRKQIIRLVA
jgi:sulfatase maturation enzyme AslB (radical SAM superfamily)